MVFQSLLVRPITKKYLKKVLLLLTYLTKGPAPALDHNHITDISGMNRDGGGIHPENERTMMRR